jgi:hypothetical protein
MTKRSMDRIEQLFEEPTESSSEIDVLSKIHQDKVRTFLHASD